jgi:hypothetical protein
MSFGPLSHKRTCLYSVCVCVCRAFGVFFLFIVVDLFSFARMVSRFALNLEFEMASLLSANCDVFGVLKSFLSPFISFLFYMIHRKCHRLLSSAVVVV